MGSNILIVDDESCILNALSRSLRSESCHVAVAQSAEEALGILAQSEFKVVISDQSMQGMQGTDFLRLVRRGYPLAVRMLITGKATTETALKAINEVEVYRLFPKPWDEAELKRAVLAAIGKYDSALGAGASFSRALQRAREQLLLEKAYPGISCVNRDSSGSLRLEQPSSRDRIDISIKLRGMVEDGPGA